MSNVSAPHNQKVHIHIHINIHYFIIQTKIKKVRVKSIFGICEESIFDKIVFQGDTWGPIIASNHVDTVGKQLLEELPEYIYIYKGYVPVGILGMWQELMKVE